MSGLQLLYYNLARGILDADPVRVRAGVIQLLRSAKEDQLASSSSTTAQTTPVVPSSSSAPVGSGSATSNARKALQPQPPTLPPLHQPPRPSHQDALVPSSIASPSLPSASLSLTPSLLPVPGADLPTDFSFDLNAMASVPAFGFGFDDLGYWGSSGGGWLNGGFSGFGSANGNTLGTAGSTLFGSINDPNWPL